MENSGLLRLNVYKHVVWEPKHIMIVDGIVAQGDKMNKVSVKRGLLNPKSCLSHRGWCALPAPMVKQIKWSMQMLDALLKTARDTVPPVGLQGKWKSQTVPHSHSGSTHRQVLFALQNRSYPYRVNKDFKREVRHDLRPKQPRVHRILPGEKRSVRIKVWPPELIWFSGRACPFPFHQTRPPPTSIL